MSDALLEISGVTKTFNVRGATTVACDDVSLSLERGRSLALVGESGSGKSTLVRMALGLLRADAGSIELLGHQIVGAKPKELKSVYAYVQMVFQNPADSFNPRRTLGDSIIDGAANAGVGKDAAKAKLPELLHEVGLPASYAGRYPSQVSGGECQRAAIARALAFNPELLVCDEATSALDVLVQAQIVELLNRLRAARGISLLFICHDLAVARSVACDVAVMLRGRIVERGPANRVIGHALHPYARLMEASVFPVTGRESWKIPSVEEKGGDAGALTGCAFYNRCPRATERCRGEKPALAVVEPGREVACWNLKENHG